VTVRRFASALFVVLLFALGQVGSSPTATADTPVTFGHPIISGIQGNGFEQDVRLDKNGVIYTSVPGALSSDTSWIWHSNDGGKTFKWVPNAQPLGGKVTTCHGGGDTELATDSTGSVYFADLTLANFSTARSDNGGKDFTCSNTGVPDSVVDRQWYAVDGDPKAGGSIYLTNDEIGPGGVQCGNSVGNNVLVMYRSPTPLGGSTAGIEFGPANQVTDPGTCDEAIMGNNEISPVPTTTGHPGTPALAAAVKHIYVVHDNAALDEILIGRCFPVAFGPPVPNVSDPSGLDCADLPVADLGPNVRTGGDFPTMAIDGAGNLYAVWELAPFDPGSGQITGDTMLMYSFSTDEGNHWSTPTQIPTPGLHTNVFAWITAGDDGRIDIAWYGTPDVANPDDPNCGTNGGSAGGPDAVTHGIWSLYFTQSLNAHDITPSFSAPLVASEHFSHKGSIQTLLGGQCGDRTLGDFLQIRAGLQGEAIISYADSNNVDEIFAPHGMVVRQSAGAGLFAAGSPVNISGLQAENAVTDPAGDGTYEAAGQVSPNIANLDVLASNVTLPPVSACARGVACYRVSMTIGDLSLASPGSPDSDQNLVWLTQWLVPADPGCDLANTQCVNGGANFTAFAESDGGGDAHCFDGENAAEALGGGVTLTYPGVKPLDPTACKFVPGVNGTVVIDVPITDVTLTPDTTPPKPIAPLDNKLHEVTASTMTLPAPSDCCGPFAGIGGTPFNLIDVAQGYTFTPGGADLSVALADAPDPVTAGHDYMYTATVQNAGPLTADGVQLTDVLPGSLSLVSATVAPSGTCNAALNLSCDLGAIAAGGSSTVTITVTAPDTPTSVANTVNVTATTADPVPGNNAADAATSVGCDVTGTDGKDVLKGTAGADIICGLGGNDTIFGKGGNDVVLGGDGNDRVFGGPGSDRLFGELGNDTLIPGADDDPMVDGGEGMDTVDYRDSSAGVVVKLAKQEVDGGSGADQLSGIENASGSNHDDAITGDGGPSVLDGRSGADHISAHASDDTVRGGLGNDRIIGGGGRDLAAYPRTTSPVNVNLTQGEAHGGGGHDVLIGIEDLSGSKGADTLTGDGGSNGLFGGPGNDRIFGRAATDVLDGGPGNDTLDGGAGADRCENGEHLRSCEVVRNQSSAEEVAEAAAILGLTASEAKGLALLVAEGTVQLPRRRR
jgi:uncharacterized repeat protein (TIGR01451 family)